MLSREKLVDTSNLSSAFQDIRRNFTPAQKLPVSVVLRHEDGVYSTDSNPLDPSLSEKNVLTWMVSAFSRCWSRICTHLLQGTMLEKFLTLPEAEFSKLLRSSPRPVVEDDGKREAYRYARVSAFSVLQTFQLTCACTFIVRRLHHALPARLLRSTTSRDRCFRYQNSCGTTNTCGPDELAGVFLQCDFLITIHLR